MNSLEIRDIFGTTTLRPVVEDLLVHNFDLTRVYAALQPGQAIFSAFGTEVMRGAFINGELGGVALGKVFHQHLKLDFLAVDETQRKTGVGSALLADYEDLAAKQGLSGVMLLPRPGLELERFYARRGYERTRGQYLVAKSRVSQ